MHPDRRLRVAWAFGGIDYDPTSRTFSKPVDVIMGLPTHDDHVGGRLVIGRDLKLYLTIGDQGSNFGGKPLQRESRAGPSHAESGQRG